MKSASLLIIAASEHDADMRYAVRMGISERIIYLCTHGRTVALLPDLELTRAKTQSQVGRITALTRYLRRATTRRTGWSEESRTRPCHGRALPGAQCP